MANNRFTLWVDEVSPYSAFEIMRSALREKEITVRYLRSCRSTESFLRFLSRISGKDIVFSEADEYLGDLRDGDWTAGMKFQFDLPDMSRTIAANLKRGRAHERLLGVLPAENLDLFVEMKVSEEIFYPLKLILAMERQRPPEGGAADVLILRTSAINRELSSICMKRGAKARLYGSLSDLRFAFIAVMKCKAKEFIFFKDLAANPGFIDSKSPVIAVHHAEGINTKMRSDIFWMKDGGIDPAKVLVYIDTSKSSSLPVSEEVCKSIRDAGASWISMNDAAVSEKAARTRIKGVRSSAGILGLLFLGRGAGLWYLATALSLYVESASWEAFYRRFNIKAVIDIGAQTSSGLAQNAALKRIGGLKFGVQRSSLTFDSNLPFLVYNGNDVFFVWGELTSLHSGTSDIIREFVISGYPFDNAFRHTAGAKAGPGKNKFVIALFDNVYSRELHYSKKMIEEFYLRFMKLLLEDESVTVIAKEKKAGYLDKIDGLKGIMEKAYATGRFIRFDNPLGILPVNASAGADMAIGVGISSAVIEAVIAGGKGIHCDTAGHSFHPYYAWGRDRLVFDDIEKLIDTLKRYKADPSAARGLGDWSEYLDKIEPYRDGRAGERIGNYMGWALQAMEREESRERAITYANEMYTARWGQGRIIKMGKAHEEA